MAEQKPFEIGLVMAGAVSAGAYTAGVVDFLLQALDQWQQAKNEDIAEVPRHEVNIKVVAGSSAGGMTGAILASMLNSDSAPITCLPEREPKAEEVDRNKLYEAWVQKIDIAELLADRDLQNHRGPVRSLLDSTVLEEIAADALRFQPGARRRPYLSDPLHFYLTLTNLRGIPYDISFKGAAAGAHRITQHTDFMHFLMSRHDPGRPGSYWLNPTRPSSEGWKQLQEAALATGAFPGGLSPRMLHRPSAQYNSRRWPVPQRPDNQGHIDQCVELKEIDPDWGPWLPPGQSSFDYEFLSVDGGVMDNEPMELARRCLAGPQLYNARHPSLATRAVLMVDPFPTEKNFTSSDLKREQQSDIVGVFLDLFNSLMMQARFKPDELMLANAEHVYSRFLIAPVRRKNGSRMRYPIASGLLGGFGGFLSRSFRMHDFQLGRRNAQQFLRRHLALPLDEARKNPVFARTPDNRLESQTFTSNGKRWVPLIPLTGTAAREVAPVQWQTLQFHDVQREKLKRQIDGRARAVLHRLIDSYINGFFSRTTARVVAHFKRGDIVDRAMQKINSDLDTFGLS